MKDDVRVLVETYLDAVEAALLRTGVSRGQRLGIVRDLEAQIQEMAAERSAGREVEAEDIRAVVAALDDPATYAQGAVRAPGVAGASVSRRLPAEALWGLAMLPAGWIGMGILIGVGSASRLRNPTDLVLLMLVATPVVLMVFLTSVLGWRTWRKVKREPRRYWGRPLAAIEIISFPLLVLIASPLLVLAAGFTALTAIVVRRAWRFMSEDGEMPLGKPIGW